MGDLNPDDLASAFAKLADTLPKLPGNGHSEDDAAPRSVTAGVAGAGAGSAGSSAPLSPAASADDDDYGPSLNDSGMFDFPPGNANNHGDADSPVADGDDYGPLPNIFGMPDFPPGDANGDANPIALGVPPGRRPRPVSAASDVQDDDEPRDEPVEGSVATYAELKHAFGVITRTKYAGSPRDPKPTPRSHNRGSDEKYDKSVYRPFVDHGDNYDVWLQMAFGGLVRDTGRNSYKRSFVWVSDDQPRSADWSKLKYEQLWDFFLTYERIQDPPYRRLSPLYFQKIYDLSPNQFIRASECKLVDAEALKNICGAFTLYDKPRYFFVPGGHMERKGGLKEKLQEICHGEWKSVVRSAVYTLKQGQRDSSDDKFKNIYTYLCGIYASSVKIMNLGKRLKEEIPTVLWNHRPINGHIRLVECMSDPAKLAFTKWAIADATDIPAGVSDDKVPDNQTWARLYNETFSDWSIDTTDTSIVRALARSQIVLKKE